MQGSSHEGVEHEPAVGLPQSDGIPIKLGQTMLIRAEVFDRTDHHAELLSERQWLLHPSEQQLQLRGNAFAIENTIDGTGTVLLRQAPLPDARTSPCNADVTFRDLAIRLESASGYPWRIAPYTGGRSGRIAAAHRLQRELRPYHAQQDGLFLTNTWGDRSRDRHLNEAFMLHEIRAAAALGADVVQIDDGWQHGVTANSSAAHKSGGAWDGFWASDPHFWEINLVRFPSGLSPLVQAARQAGVKIGLWFAPDGSNDASHWRRDAEQLLHLHRREGIDFFKIDALKITSPASERNLRELFATVIRESGGRVSFDFDITAERRFGYFDLIADGRLFVENRYTDWHNYWPHQTLRQLWMLSHWVDPVRLRLEWLNHARNASQYGDDPLAPACYRPDTLFATVMLASPLGWFETQHLPPSYMEQTAPLITKWKRHRAAIHQSTVLPIGSVPDGYNWTGFICENKSMRETFILAFRELNADRRWNIMFRDGMDSVSAPEILAGQGLAQLSDSGITIEIDEPLGFLWVRIIRH